MRAHHRLRRAFAAACAAGALAVVALSFGSASAAAETTDAELSLNGVITADSPSGTPVLSIAAGDTVTFSAPKSAAGSKGGLGYYVKLNAAGLPGGASSVSLSSSKTYPVTFDSAGAYSLSWSAKNVLGVPIHATSANATVVVAAPPSDPTDPSSPGQPPPGQSSSGQPNPGQSSSGQPNPGQHSSGQPSGSHSTGSGSGIILTDPFGHDGAGSIPFVLTTGFAAPHPDTGAASGTAITHTTSAPTGTGTGSSSAGKTPDPTSSSPDQTAAASVSTPPTSPPTALAIASIAALAVVTAFYAHRHLLGQARHASMGR